MPPIDRQLRLLVRHSGSSKDRALAEELLGHLKPLERFANLDVWSDAQIRPGDETHREIERAIQQADVALLLLSADFLSTDGLLDVEVPKLLERHRQGSLRVVPILLRSCLWEVHPWLKELRPLPKDGKALASLQGDERDRVVTELAKEIAGLATPAKSAKKATGTRAKATAAKRAETTGTRAKAHALQPKTSGDTYHIQIHGSTIGGMAVGTRAKAKGNATTSPDAPAEAPRRSAIKTGPQPKARHRKAIIDAALIEEKYSGLVASCRKVRRTVERSSWQVLRELVTLTALDPETTPGLADRPPFVTFSDLLFELEKPEGHIQQELDELSRHGYIIWDEDGIELRLGGKAKLLWELGRKIVVELIDANQDASTASDIFDKLVPTMRIGW